MNVRIFFQKKKFTLLGMVHISRLMAEISMFSILFTSCFIVYAYTKIIAIL